MYLLARGESNILPRRSVSHPDTEAQRNQKSVWVFSRWLCVSVVNPVFCGQLKCPLGVECGHDSTRPSRHPGLPGLQEAASVERWRREPEVWRVPPRLSGSGQHSHFAGGRGCDRSLLTLPAKGRSPIQTCLKNEPLPCIN